MNFLNPLYLFALAAVAVPILIHIFSRRRVPEIPFSTIRFLNPSDRRSMVRINLRRLLLLILRILGIALLALAFARPVVRGKLAALFPAGSSRAACILLDRSYSMGVEGDGGPVFDRAKARLVDVLDHLSEEDAVSVILFDSAPEAVYEGDLSREAILGVLDRAKLSWSGTDLRAAAAFGARNLEASGRDARELYIISDFQRSALGPSPRTAGAGGKARDNEGAAPADVVLAGAARERLPIRALLLPVRSPDVANVAIEDVLTPRTTLHRGEIAQLTVVLRNTSKELAQRFPLEVSVGGRRVVEKEIEVAPESYFSESVTVPVEREGWLDGVVRKRPDRLPADDARYFALHVRDRARVLLIADEESFYLEQALSPGGAGEDIALTKRGWRTFATGDLAAAEVAVLGPGRGPEPRDVALLDRFVSSGGHAVVFLLPGTEETAKRLSRYPLRIVFADAAEGFYSVEKPPQTPYFLAPFSEEDLAAFARLRFGRAPLASGVPRGAEHLAFSTGQPFVWEERRGGGTVVFVALEPQPDAGEIVLSPYFLPLVQQLVLSTDSTDPESAGSLVGAPIVWNGDARGEIVCELPDGTSLKPARAGNGPGAEREGGIVVPPVETPGFVAIRDGDGELGRIAVNPDCRDESELAFMSAREAADSLGLENRLVVEEGAEIAAAIRSAREGKEIAVPLLLAAMAVFVAEIFVAQRERTEGA